MRYRIYLPVPVECSKCGGKLKDCVYRGKASWVCCDQQCRARVSAASQGLLEGSHLSGKEFLMLLYFWAHDSGGVTARVRAEEMLGHGHSTSEEGRGGARHVKHVQQLAFFPGL